MKKIIISGALLLTSLLVAEPTYLSKEKIAEIGKSSKRLANTYTRIIEGIDEKDTYFLDLQHKGKNVNCFVDKKTGTIYVGRRYEKNGEESIFIKSPERIKKFKKIVTEGISFSYGTGKKELYLFTDPECPYCTKFEKKAKGLLADYTVHVILYPLRFHKKAPMMVEWIMQGSDDKEKHARAEAIMVDNSQAYTVLSPKKGEKFRYSDNTQKSLNKAIKAKNILAVKGTPNLFDANFNKLNWGKFLREIKAKK